MVNSNYTQFIRLFLVYDSLRKICVLQKELNDEVVPALAKNSSIVMLGIAIKNAIHATLECQR